MAFLIKNWRLTLFFCSILLAVLGTGAAAFLWERNAELKTVVAVKKAEIIEINEAREKDAIAAAETLRAIKEQHLLLQARLASLSEITNEQDRAYLNTPVPDSIRGLLNP